MNLSQFLQATPNVFLFRYAPQRFSIRYLNVLGTLYYTFNRKEKNLIKQNIMTVLKSREDANEIIKRVFKGIFSHYAEKLIMAYRDFDTLEKEMSESITYIGLEYLDDALKKGSVVLVTGHFGAVEFMPLALYLRHYQISMVVSFQTQKLKESLTTRAMKGDVELIDGNGEDVLLQAISALKRKRIFITECDEVDTWKSKGDRTIEAFGGRIRLDRSLEVLFRRTKATFLAAFMIRKGSKYSFTIIPIIIPINNENQKIMDEGISVVILKTLEEFVMMFPEQWYQWKNFQKMRPVIA